LLGGNPEAMTREYCLHQKLAIPYTAAPAVIGGDGAESTPTSNMVLFQQEGKIFQVPAEQWKPIYDQFVEQCRAEHDEVIALGGLHILGTERHEARRIDNQLRGRAGRQGDPGSSRFFLSLEDDLLRVFGGERVKALMYRLGMTEGIPIESKLISRRIENAQMAVEAQNFEARKHLLEYDDVMNKQRETIYSIRRSALEGKEQKDYALSVAEDIARELVETYCPANEHPEKWNVTQFAAEVLNQYGMDVKAAGIDPTRMNHAELADTLVERVKERYSEKEKLFGEQMMRWLERRIILDIVDTQWKDHLLTLDHLKEGIGLRGYGQKDPLVEFKKEAFTLFEDMMGRIDTETVRYLFLVQPARPEDEAREIERRQRRQQQEMQLQAGAAAAEQPKPVRTGAKVGRNDPCPCGSGKKYKKCHGAAA
jgi:preprotein translocase subunit SecA